MIFQGEIDMYNTLKMDYPRPFELYASQLPRRSPMSCVLDMIVHLERPENELQIKNKLRRLMEDLREVDRSKILSSSTICVSHARTSESRHYGVSMSTFDCLPGKIMVAASCFSNWDDFVADAVMTYFPDEKKYFDGSIKLPEDIRCQAFNISGGTEMNPCKSCGNLFGLNTNETEGWPYGNCAEVESLSNLFKNEQEVKIRATPQSDSRTEENRQRARNNLSGHLKKCWLKTVNFKWHDDFYTSTSMNK
ncbi:uncharacterized protein LOC133461158 [Cololabis saira]|uniref:uncharacterized protein LOC133461158 n=1 Tax=Cololabis saira TaxID=129043 RepID=UPI002AD3D225|nr:uncharacterized protein LOC133461158 [Cololabis saira]